MTRLGGTCGLIACRLISLDRGAYWLYVDAGHDTPLLQRPDTRLSPIGRERSVGHSGHKHRAGSSARTLPAALLPKGLANWGRSIKSRRA